MWGHIWILEQKLKIKVKREASYNIAYKLNLKNGKNKSIYKAEIESQIQKINLWLLDDKELNGINWEI